MKNNVWVGLIRVATFLSNDDYEIEYKLATTTLLRFQRLDEDERIVEDGIRPTYSMELDNTVYSLLHLSESFKGIKKQ